MNFAAGSSQRAARPFRFATDNVLWSVSNFRLYSSSSMTILQIASAMIELGAGLALLCLPSAAATLLVGAPLE